jgi:hypothetical protein
MNRTREEFDADINEGYVGISEFKTEQNVHEIFCEYCLKPFFADTQTFESFQRALEHGSEGGFICDNCREAHEDMAYSAK